jgi:hypothetical protein
MRHRCVICEASHSGSSPTTCDHCMTVFLSELGKRLADRWLTALALPGLLYVGAIGVAAMLGGGGSLSVGEVMRDTEDELVRAGLSPSDTSSFAIATVLVGALLAAAGCALVAQALGVAVERQCSGSWPSWMRPFGRWLTDRRRRRWDAAQQAFDESRTSDGTTRDELAASRNRIGLARPRRPTWIGDRFDAADLRIWREYGLDLSFCWSRLWLVMPEASRQALQHARNRYAAATVLGGWSVLYTLLVVLWSPAGLVGVAVGLVSWRRARTAAEVLADLVEAAVDIHGRDLASAVGVAIDGGILGPVQGRQITQRLRKSV